MKAPQFFSLLASSIIALVLTVVLIVLGQGSKGMEQKLQAEQADISRGNMSQQIGTNLLREIAIASQKSAKLKDVLAKNGYTLKETPAPGASPSPAAAAASPTP